MRNQELLAKIACLEKTNASHVTAKNATSIAALIKKADADALDAAKIIALLKTTNEGLTCRSPIST